jgi:vacuolar protein sorting-associated protein 72
MTSTATDTPLTSLPSDDDFSDGNLASLPASPTSERVSASPPAAPIESLVAGRARRANAGNLLHKLLTQEADEEDTLFLEDEDDVEFEVKEKEDLSDVQLESSDEDDDDAPPAEGEDEEMVGERELVRAEKEEKRARKRKADEVFMKPRKGPVEKKKVTIQEQERDKEELTALTRPRKKSERISWVPEFVATRASSRTLSLQNRSETMRRLEESEKRRLHTIALMEAAAAKKVKKGGAKREMTQEERLAEAKITEKRNRKSLYSWEETEKMKTEEQRKRLAALQNRKLAGPVMTYWSGRAEWNMEGRLVKVGKKLVQEVETKTRKEKGKGKEKDKGKGKDREVAVEAAKDAGAVGESSTSAPMKGPATADIPADGEARSRSAPAPTPVAPSDSDIIRVQSAPVETPTMALQLDRKDIPSFLDGIYEHSKLPPQQAKSTPIGTPQNPHIPQAPAPAPAEPPGPKEIGARNLVILESFEWQTIRDRASIVKTLWGDQARRLRELTLSLFVSKTGVPTICSNGQTLLRYNPPPSQVPRPADGYAVCVAARL